MLGQLIKSWMGVNPVSFSNKVNEFLTRICDQIRWEKAHGPVCKEIKDHIIDQKDAFMDEGLDEAAALDRAIEEMGDPVLIGNEFDRTHRPKPQWNMLIFTGFLLVLGFGIRFIASLEPDTPFMFRGSLIASLVGILALALVYFADFTILGKYPKTIFVGFTIFLILGFQFTPIIKGQHGYMQFLLLLYPTLIAGIVYIMRTRGYIGLAISGLASLVPLLIAFRIPSLSLGFLLLIASLVLLTMAIAKGWFKINKLHGYLGLYIPTVLGLVSVFLVDIRSNSYRLSRLLANINVSRDPMGDSYLALKIRDMVSNARLIGRGSLKANPYLIPAINTDYILTYIIYRLGWLAFGLLVAILVYFIISLFKEAHRQKSVLGSLVSTAALLTFTLETLLYLISNLGFPLVTSTLPLISYSGMATIVNLVLIGVMLSVFRTGHVVEDSLLIVRDKKSI